ncbi:MAG: Tm-1-like ATP-binding domain-containing protein, partial [Dehalococcoidia bacterium]
AFFGRRPMKKTIVIVGTLDTKADEVRYIADLITNRGHRTLIIDPGILGQVPFKPDVTREQVSEAAGTSLDQVISLGDEGEAIEVMARGTWNVVRGLYSSGEMDGIVVLGGSMGTSLGLPVLGQLPLLMPKLMVSTVAHTQIISTEAVSADLTVMPTVADIWGLNRITKRVLSNAAGAISGMVESYSKEEESGKPLVGLPTLGSAALRYVPFIKPLLEERGYEVAVFHTNGMGGRVFEQFVEHGVFTGALDLSMQELMGYVCNGSNPVSRLEAATKRALPQVVAPGAVDWFCHFGSLNTLPAQYKSRTIHMHNPQVVEIRTSREEKISLGETMAERINRALGPTIVLLPAAGVSERDKPGGVFFDPEGRRAMIDVLKKNLEPRIEVRELDMHINDPDFSLETVEAFDKVIDRAGASNQVSGATWENA